MYDTLESLNRAKESLPDRFKKCKALAKPLSKAREAWLKAQAKADDNPKKYKLSVKATELKQEFAILLKDGLGEYKRYKKTVDDIDNDYAKIIYDEPKRSQRHKLEKEADKFKSQQQRLISALDGMYQGYIQYCKELGISDRDMSATRLFTTPDANDIQLSAPKQNYRSEQTVPVYSVPQPQYAQYPQPGVHIAPVSIDISSIVENAVRNAMAKFTSVFEARANAYLDSARPCATQSGESASVLSEGTVDMANKVLDDEKFVLDKLIALIEGLKEVTQNLSELSLAYSELAEKQKEANDSARRVNDMQRALSRELQGVQASQKVITQDQISVTDEQHELYERQKTALDKQRALIEAQKALGNTQRALMENHKSLEGAMKELLSTQDGNIAAENESAPPLEELAQDMPQQTVEESPAETVENSIEQSSAEILENALEESPAQLLEEAVEESPAEPETGAISREIDQESGKDKLLELECDEASV